MNSPSLVAVCIVAACLSGAGSAFFLSNQGDTESSLEESRDFGQSLDRLGNRLGEIETKLDAMEQRRLQSPPLDTETLRRLQRDHDNEMADLRAELSKLKEMRPAASRGELTAALGDEAAIDQALSRYVEKEMSKQNKKRRELERKRFTPFIRAQMENQMKKTIEKLKLRPDQAERFEESVKASMDKVMPAIGIVMDPGAKKEEKMEAFQSIDGAMSEVDADAKSYMDQTQYDTFKVEQEKQNKQMERMRNMFGGGTNGATSAPSGG